MIALPKLVLIAVLLFLSLPLAGCDTHAEDQAALEQAWKNYYTYNDQRNGSALAAMLTDESLAHYDGLLKHVFESKAEVVGQLPLCDRLEICRARARAKRSDLKGLNGRGYVIYATNQGWYSHGQEPDPLGSFTFSADGTTATAPILVEVEVEQKRGFGRRRGLVGAVSAVSSAVAGDTEMVETGHTARFVKQEGVWKLDEQSITPYYNELLGEFAKIERKSERDLIMMMVSMESGKKVTMKVWDPLK